MRPTGPLNPWLNGAACNYPKKETNEVVPVICFNLHRAPLIFPEQGVGGLGDRGLVGNPGAGWSESGAPGSCVRSLRPVAPGAPLSLSFSSADAVLRGPAPTFGFFRRFLECRRRHRRAARLRLPFTSRAASPGSNYRTHPIPHGCRLELRRLEMSL